jgi:hypothetical protein
VSEPAADIEEQRTLLEALVKAQNEQGRRLANVETRGAALDSRLMKVEVALHRMSVGAAALSRWCKRADEDRGQGHD